MATLKEYAQSFRQWLRIEVFREAVRQYPVICFLLMFMLLSTIILNRYLHILMIFWSFLAGVITFYCSISPEYLLPNILFHLKPKGKPSEQQELFPSGHSCAVCGKRKCNRHRPTLLLENYQPWLDLKVYSKVDASISEVLELILENFVYPWYRDITDDEACVDELRMMFRFFGAVIVRRAQKVDFPSLFTGKMAKVAMKHVEIMAKAWNKVSQNPEHLQQAALDEYGPDLHIALRSRKDELIYLRKLTDMLFPYIVPPKAPECRSLAYLLREVMTGSVVLPTLDFMADPDTLNHMVLIYIDDTPPEEALEPPSAFVPFLQKFATPRSKKSSVLKLELKEIRDQQDLLFRFMSFLKAEGAVHVLQFCLAAEEFNDKILCPDLNEAEMQRLHGEVQNIYKTYCLDESIDKIRFDPFIVEEIRNIAQGPYQEVVKLQTMRCLFEAYEHVLSLLENVFTPMFCHSDEYFRYLLCGAESPARNTRLIRNSMNFDEYSPQPPHVPTTLNHSGPKRGDPKGSRSPNSWLRPAPPPVRTPSPVHPTRSLSSSILSSLGTPLKNTSKRGESFGISRIGSRIKGVFRSTTLEGAMPPNYGMVDGSEDQVEEATVVVEDDSPAELVSTPGTLRNLSAWIITIPYVDFFEDEIKREKIPVFCIAVERNDRKEVGHEKETWVVYRRYLEFYVLESKLTEFHGTFADTQLPSKRIIGPKNFEFLSSKRGEFEDYLQKLLQHLELSNSQLLADFLSPYSVESQFLDKMLPDVNLGKIFKSVPGKLMKEKGQNLEPFIQSFFNSCESPKPKPSKPELTIVSPTAENKKLFNGLFKNNTNLSESAEKKHNQNYFMEVMPLEGVYDYMMFMGRLVFRIPDWLHHALCGGRILLKRTLEAYMDHYLQSKLDQQLQEHRMVSLVTLLRDSVFCETVEVRSMEDKQKRAKQAFEEMMNYIPDAVVKCIGEEARYEGVRLLFEMLQQPLLNKQMTYVLLDLAVQELFPELQKTQKDNLNVSPKL